mmetsp:Transcript_34085/g.62739  ORF Transcript_34085/g.62739 Transcript_34085/m.62739 type:complete len:258 (+) Transcript_34085:1217-1990(+)
MELVMADNRRVWLLSWSIMKLTDRRVLGSSLLSLVSRVDLPRDCFGYAAWTWLLGIELVNSGLPRLAWSDMKLTDRRVLDSLLLSLVSRVDLPRGGGCGYAGTRTWLLALELAVNDGLSRLPWSHMKLTDRRVLDSSLFSLVSKALPRDCCGYAEELSWLELVNADLVSPDWRSSCWSVMKLMDRSLLPQLDSVDPKLVSLVSKAEGFEALPPSLSIAKLTLAEDTVLLLPPLRDERSEVRNATPVLALGNDADLEG